MELPNPLPEGYTRFAVVQKDPVSSGSTGGVVVDIMAKDTSNAGDEQGTPPNQPYMTSDYLWVESDTAEIGWIYQDKTNILVDSNLSNN